MTESDTELVCSLNLDRSEPHSEADSSSVVWEKVWSFSFLLSCRNLVVGVEDTRLYFSSSVLIVSR